MELWSRQMQYGDTFSSTVTYWQCSDGLSLPELVELSEGLAETEKECGVEDETRLVSLSHHTHIQLMATLT